MSIIKKIEKYLKEKDDADICKHCHKSKPLKGRAICSKCANELNSIKDKDKED